MGGRPGRIVAAAAAALAVAITVPTLAVGSADVALSVSVEVTPAVTVGDDLVATGVVSNGGSAPADDVTLVLSLPPENAVLSSVAPPPPACQASPPELPEEVACSLGTIDGGASTEVVLVVSVVEAGLLSVGAEATSGGGAGTAEAVVRVEGHGCDRVGTQGHDELAAGPSGEVLCGLGGRDRLVGGRGDDVLYGGSGDDVLEASGGNDLLDGGDGRNTASFVSSPGGVRADLALGTVTGWGSDRVVRMQNLVGSRGDDVVLGDGRANRLEGRGGSDVIRGRGGPDALSGGPGADYLHGGPGADVLHGGPGDDICVAWGRGSRAACQPRHPRDPRDTRGPLDVVRVRTALGSRTPLWSVRTRGSWGTRAMWDRGYVIVWLDGRGAPRPTHYALLRSTGGGVSGALYRVRPGRDRKLGPVRTWRPNRRGISVRIPLRRVRPGPHRDFYRWGVQTLFTGRGCRRVCFDPVPGPDRMFVQPLP